MPFKVLPGEACLLHLCKDTGTTPSSSERWTYGPAHTCLLWGCLHCHLSPVLHTPCCQVITAAFIHVGSERIEVLLVHTFWNSYDLILYIAQETFPWNVWQCPRELAGKQSIHCRSHCWLGNDLFCWDSIVWAYLSWEGLLLWMLPIGRAPQEIKTEEPFHCSWGQLFISEGWVPVLNTCRAWTSINLQY